MTIADGYVPAPTSYRVVCQTTAEDWCYLVVPIVYRNFPDAYRLKAAHRISTGHPVVVEPCPDE